MSISDTLMGAIKRQLLEEIKEYLLGHLQIPRGNYVRSLVDRIDEILDSGGWPDCLDNEDEI